MRELHFRDGTARALSSSRPTDDLLYFLSRLPSSPLSEQCLISSLDLLYSTTRAATLVFTMKQSRPRMAPLGLPLSNSRPLRESSYPLVVCLYNTRQLQRNAQSWKSIDTHRWFVPHGYRVYPSWRFARRQSDYNIERNRGRSTVLSLTSVSSTSFLDLASPPYQPRSPPADVDDLFKRIFAFEKAGLAYMNNNVEQLISLCKKQLTTRFSRLDPRIFVWDVNTGFNGRDYAIELLKKKMDTILEQLWRDTVDYGGFLGAKEIIFAAYGMFREFDWLLQTWFMQELAFTSKFGPSEEYAENQEEVLKDLIARIPWIRTTDETAQRAQCSLHMCDVVILPSQVIVGGLHPSDKLMLWVATNMEWAPDPSKRSLVFTGQPLINDYMVYELGLSKMIRMGVL